MRRPHLASESMRVGTDGVAASAACAASPTMPSIACESNGSAARRVDGPSQSTAAAARTRVLSDLCKGHGRAERHWRGREARNV
jgi:hypothetical protein